MSHPRKRNFDEFQEDSENTKLGPEQKKIKHISYARPTLAQVSSKKSGTAKSAAALVPTCSKEEWKRRIAYVSEPVCDDNATENLPKNIVKEDEGIFRTNTLHLILDVENFPLDPYKPGAVSAKVLKEMNPSFALCTNILTNRAVAEPWLHAMSSTVVHDTKSELSYLKLADGVNLKSGFDRLQKELSYMQIKFLFVAFDFEKGNGQLHGLHLMPGEPGDPKVKFRVLEGTDQAVLEDLQQYHRVHINAAYYDYS